MERKRSWRTQNDPLLFTPNDQSAYKGADAVYLLGLERHCSLRTPSEKSDVEFRHVLSNR